MLAAAGLSVTAATGTLLTVTSPAAETVAIAGFELVHVTARPISAFPAASLGVAVSCTVAPTYRFGAVGPTVTEATGTLDTVAAAVPLCPSLVAVIVPAPTATPVTSPAADTV